MMDNQHKQIKGYRDLSQEEIDLMNEIKAEAEQVHALVSRVQLMLLDQEERGHTNTTDPLRWLAEARTDLQKGFMCLTRSVAQPTTF